MIDRHDILVFTAEAQYAAGEPWITIAVTPTYLRAIEAAGTGGRVIPIHRAVPSTSACAAASAALWRSSLPRASSSTRAARGASRRPADVRLRRTRADGAAGGVCLSAARSPGIEGVKSV